jgi:hypothetical protein
LNLSRIVAIDLEPNGAYITSGTNRKGQIVVERAVALPIEENLTIPAQAEAAGKKLRDILKQAGISPGPTIILVGRDKLIPKEVKYPNVPAADEPAVIRFQAAKDISDNIDDLILDYLPMGNTPEGGKKATVFFLKKEFVKTAQTICNTAGLKLISITPRSYAVAEGYKAALATGVEPPDSPEDAVGILYPTGNGGEFIVVRDKQVLFSRPVSDAAMRSENSLISELKRNIAVVGAQIPGGIAALYIAESEAPGASWSGRLREGLPLPVRTFNPLATSPVANAVPGKYTGQFAPSAGAIQFASAKGPYPINFVTPRQPKAEPSKGRSLLMLGILAALLLFGAMALTGYLLNESADKDIAKLEAEKKDQESEQLIALQSSKRADFAKEFNEHRIRLHDELYDWTEMAPDVENFRLSQIDFVSVPLPTEKERKALPSAQNRPAGSKAPPKPAGTVTFNIQTNDSKHAEQFLEKLTKENRNYISPKKEGGQVSGTAKLNQTFTIRTSLVARKPDEFTRKLNVAIPKPRAKALPEDEGDSGQGDFR